MCDVAVGLAVASTLVSAYGAYQQGQAQKEQGEYQAKVAEVQAEDARQAGIAAEEQHRAKVRQLMGEQRASMGASGLEVGSGSFGRLLTDTAGQGERDAWTIRSNALKRAWGFETEAATSRAEGRMAATAGKLNAFGTLLGGASKAYGMGKDAGYWGKAKTPGAAGKNINPNWQPKEKQSDF